MKLKYHFEITQIGDEYLGVPVSSEIVEFKGLLKLNETAVFIVDGLKEDISENDLTQMVSDKFLCDFNEAKENVNNIVDLLKSAGLILD